MRWKSLPWVSWRCPGPQCTAPCCSLPPGWASRSGRHPTDKILLATTFLWYKEYCFLEKMTPVFLSLWGQILIPCLIASYLDRHLSYFNASCQFDIASVLHLIVKNTQISICSSFCQLSKSPPAQPYCQLTRLPPILRICQLPVVVASTTYSIDSCQGCRSNLPYLNASYPGCHVAYLVAISTTPNLIASYPGCNLPYLITSCHWPTCCNLPYLIASYPGCHLPFLQRIKAPGDWTLQELCPLLTKNKIQVKKKQSTVAALFPVKADINNCQDLNAYPCI